MGTLTVQVYRSKLSGFDTKLPLAEFPLMLELSKLGRCSEHTLRT